MGKEWHLGIMDKDIFLIAVFAMKFTRITVNPAQMGGVPCIRGLRIPVATVIGSFSDVG